ncbi:hypothetical protein, partial [Salegentibacter chungangensis]
DADGGTISFYSSQANADAGTPALTGTDMYSSTGGETIYVRSDNNNDGTEGCYGTTSFTLTVYDNPTATATGGNLPCTDSGFQLMGSASGGTAPYDYSWTGPGGFTSDEQNPIVLVTGTYTLTVEDANGCTDTDTATVDPPENCAHIFPTQTDCEDYRCITQSTDPDPIDYTLSNVCITLNGDIIDNAVPGVFFYYADVTGKAGSTTVYIDQDSDLTKYFIAQNEQNVRVYSSECGTIEPTSVTIYDHSDGTDQGDVEITFSSTAGTSYIISVKYDVKTILGGMLVGSDPYASFEMQYGNGDPVGGSQGQISLNTGEFCDPDPIEDPDDCEFDNNLVESNDVLTTQSLVAESGFSVAPVPFKETLTVYYEFDYVSNVQIQFFDLSGHLLRTYADKNVTSGDATQIDIDFALKANQVYVMRVVTDRESFSKSVMSGN